MKESMEVTEVLAPQFVIPVAAVVLCALLVFMFGFTHAPEPTFDYESSDDKKTKKTKGKKKAEKVVQSNGHVINIEPVKPVTSQTVKSSSEKKETVKQKKKPPIKILKQDPEVETAEEDEGGWTTAVSKKEKKKKKFDEDTVQQISKDEYATSNSEVDDEPSASSTKSTSTGKSAGSPQEQRMSKKSKKTKTGQPKTQEYDQKDGNREDTLNEEVVETEKAENKPEVVLLKEVEENTATVKPETPKKNKKKKKKTDAETMVEQDIEADTKDSKVSEAQKVAETRSIEVEIADAMRETSNGIQAEAETVKVESKSPSKNKKKQKGPSKKESEAPVSQVTSSQALNSSRAVTNTRSDVSHSSLADLEKVSPAREMQVKNANSKKKGEPIESNSKAASASTAAAVVVTADIPSAKNTEAGGDTNPSAAVSFDELGGDEWQEAKPVKKRKKPRRDN